MPVPFQLIFSQFQSNTTLVSVVPFGNGHIHDTYKLTSREEVSFILQKINKKVFSDIPALQSNIEKVIDHINSQKRDSIYTLNILKTSEGTPYYLDGKGNYWRVFNYIPGSQSYDRVLSEAHAYEAGKAYGTFQRLFKDFSPSKLHETLPDFHNIESRLALFDRSVLENPMKRVAEIKDEIDFVWSRAQQMKRIFEKGQTGLIPLRITHNDTKINNVLFGKDDKAICVIDLDTVMPGYIHYDYGDAIRTGAASADEGETDLSKMCIDLKLFEAYSRGFLEQTIEFIDQEEMDELYFAPQLLTFIIALRFLTDYLNGDIYFKVDHEKHNLQRWFAQKQLLLSMEENENEMKQIIEKIETSLKK